MKARLSWIIAAATLAVAALPQSASACATCYGASDSPLAQGMNWGIATLLGVVGAVLFGVAAFFVHVGVKSARLHKSDQSHPQTETPQ